MAEKETIISGSHRPHNHAGHPTTSPAINPVNRGLNFPNDTSINYATPWGALPTGPGLLAPGHQGSVASAARVRAVQETCPAGLRCGRAGHQGD